MSKQAILLAGGLGTRLWPYTVSLPKPLVPIGRIPIAEIIIRQLSAQGFDKVTMAVNHQAEILMAYFGDGKKWNIKIEYSLETSPLSTMGPLGIIHDLPEDFLILNGDVLTDMDFSEFLTRHISSKSIFTISSAFHRVQVDFGVLEVNNQSFLESISEKPHFEFNVSMGVYAASIEVLKYIKNNEPLGFDELMRNLLVNNDRVFVDQFDGFWLDIGRPKDYELATNLVEEEKLNFNPFN